MLVIANFPETRRVERAKIRTRKFMNRSQQDLLPRIASGDSAAVSMCIEKYGNLVWTLARRSLSDRQAAEDAVQEVFLKLWEVAGRFNSQKASETTFVAMIARRKLIDIHRKRTLPVETEIEFDGFSGAEPDVAAESERRDEAAKAAELLHSLPRDQQTVIKMNVIDGLSHSKIAESTGLSLGTVKTNIRRGLLKLRKALFPEADLYRDDSWKMAASGEVNR